MDRRNVSKVLLASAAGVGLFAQRALARTRVSSPPATTAAERAAGIIPANCAYEPGNVLRYRAAKDSDDSAAFNRALAVAVTQGGGTIRVPSRTYAVALDWSRTIIAGGYGPIFIEGEGGTRLVGKSGASAVLKIDRGGTGDNWRDSALQFRGIEFVTESNDCSGGTPAIPYAVDIRRSAAVFVDCKFSGGAVAAFHILNGQYNQFFRCQFRCASRAGNPGAGLHIESRYSETSANEIIIDACVFNSNRNGLYAQGVSNLRIQNTRFQEHWREGEGALVVKDYLDSVGSESIYVLGCWFEANEKRDVYMPAQTNRVVFMANFFTGKNGGEARYRTKVASIEAASPGNNVYLGNNFRTASGPTLTISGDNAGLVYLGNDKDPAVTAAAANPQGIIQYFESRYTDFLSNRTAARTSPSRQ